MPGIWSLLVLEIYIIALIAYRCWIPAVLTTKDVPLVVVGAEFRYESAVGMLWEDESMRGVKSIHEIRWGYLWVFSKEAFYAFQLPVRGLYE